MNNYFNSLKIYNNEKIYKLKNYINIHYLLRFKFIQLIWYFIFMNSKDRLYSNIQYINKIITINNNNILYSYSKNTNYDNIIIICHPVCGDYSHGAYLASKFIKFNNSLIISYSRKGVHKHLNNDNFNIVGCPHILDEIVNYTYKNFDKKPIYAIGFSAGTSLLSTYLGKFNKHIQGAILISPGYCFQDSMNDMPIIAKILGFINIYTYYFHMFNNCLIKTFHLNSFINKLYTQLQYKNIDEYYEYHDPIHVLENINIPILFINSKDDICFPNNSIKKHFPITLTNNNIVIFKFKYGSHLAFFNNFKDDPIYFNISIKFFNLLKKNNNQMNILNYLDLINS